MKREKLIKGLWYKRRRLLQILVLTLLWIPASFSQEITVLRTSGTSGMISEGTSGGIKKGDLVSIKRMQDGSLKEITFAEVIESEYNLATIQIPEDAPVAVLKIGDKVEKMDKKQRPSTISTATQKRKTKAQTPATGKSKSQTQKTTTRESAARRSSPTGQRSKAQTGNAVPRIQRIRGVYLGPMAGVFVPLGKMKENFQSTFGYGGILGVQFRQEWDISTRFFYTSKSEDDKNWSIWNLQLVGRKYLPQGVFFDFGYGIFYPQVETWAATSSTIRLGFIGGIGFTFPVTPTVWCEIGCLVHYYPNFGKESGQMLTIQGSLIL